THIHPLPYTTLFRSNNVGPDYFRSIGIPILRGREFTAADRKGSQAVVIVNETFARTVFGKTDPVGHTITTDFANDKTKLIVGLRSEEHTSELQSRVD